MIDSYANLFPKLKNVMIENVSIENEKTYHFDCSRNKNNHSDCDGSLTYLIAIMALSLLCLILTILTIKRLFKYYCDAKESIEVIDSEIPSCTILNMNEAIKEEYDETKI